MQVSFDTSSVESYRLFLKVKALPSVRFVGRTAIIPDEYSHLLNPSLPCGINLPDYEPLSCLFDYQRDISKIAIKKRKFAIFCQCGSGKTLIILEFARYVSRLISPNRRVLIVTPLMVVPQFIEEVKRFYGDVLQVEQVRAAALPAWVAEPGMAIGITNYEALSDRVSQGRIGALLLDESSMLKSDYGKHALDCIRLGEGLDWKLCATGTPAPNDRTEFANHAIFLDQFPTINSFLSKYFVNKGKTGERWELKGHAVDAFYKDLSHWCIFLNSPAVYGWRDNCDNIPPINVNIHDVELTTEQKVAATDGTGMLFPIHAGGITRRSEMSRIAKGRHNGKKISTNKFDYIKSLIDSWPDESTIVWALHNAEQNELERVIPGAVSIQGTTPYLQRLEMISAFQAGRRKVLISKARILGLGLNLQIATRHVFSSCVDSFEAFFQAIKRSNRYGSILPLNVHIPVSDLETVMMENVLDKWKRVQEDMETCERVFRVHLHDAGFVGERSVMDVG